MSRGVRQACHPKLHVEEGTDGSCFGRARTSGSATKRQPRHVKFLRRFMIAPRQVWARPPRLPAGSWQTDGRREQRENQSRGRENNLAGQTASKTTVRTMTKVPCRLPEERPSLPRLRGCQGSSAPHSTLDGAPGHRRETLSADRKPQVAS
jgi:hypothetical protein